MEIDEVQGLNFERQLKIEHLWSQFHGAGIAYAWIKH